jgi:hypothetical protein
MSVVEPDETRSIRRVQRERIPQAVRPSWRRFNPADFEFEPIAVLEIVDTPVERQEEFQRMIRRVPIHIIRGYDSALPGPPTHHASQRRRDYPRIRILRSSTMTSLPVRLMSARRGIARRSIASIASSVAGCRRRRTTPGVVAGVWFCETHGRRVVDRAALESSGIQLEHPPVGNMFCPVSGQGFGPTEESEQFFEEQ